MKRPDEILNECVFDNTIKKDTATVTVEVAIEAMKRYSSEIASKQREVDNAWQKKAPDKVGYWIRMNVIHRPEIHYVFEDWKNPDKALRVNWGWTGEEAEMRIKDNLHKIEHFHWLGPIVIPPREFTNKE